MLSESCSLMEVRRANSAPIPPTTGRDPTSAILEDPSLSMGEKLLLIESLFAHDSTDGSPRARPVGREAA
jgi:hypothetical protein